MKLTAHRQLRGKLFTVSDFIAYRINDVAKNKKTELDDLLAMYNVKYDLKLNLKEDRHGNINAKPDLRFIRKHNR